MPANTACLSRTCAESLSLQHPDFRTVQVQQEGGGHDPCAGEPTSPHNVVHCVLVQFVCMCYTRLIPRPQGLDPIPVQGSLGMRLILQEHTFHE